MIRVAVVQHGAGSHQPLMDLVTPWHAGVCAGRGYAYHPSTEDLGAAWETRPNEWARFDLLARVWDSADVIWWLDADAVMVNPEIDLGWPMTVDGHLGTDESGNSGVFWIKTTPEGRRILDAIRGMSDGERRAYMTGHRPQDVRYGQCWEAMDVLVYNTPRRLRIAAHVFGEAWNHWRHRSNVRAMIRTARLPRSEVQIEAWHGVKPEQRKQEMEERVRQLTGTAAAPKPSRMLARILVVQHGVGDHAELIRTVKPWHEHLAAKHAFRYLGDTAEQSAASQYRPSAWARFKLIQREWEAADLIWWLDADAVMVNPEIDLGWPLDVPEEAGLDRVGNSGVFWLKTTPAARVLVNHLLSLEGSYETQLRGKRKRFGQAGGPLDRLMDEAPSLAGASLHRFGGEWNCWNRGAAFSDGAKRVEIRAFHGENPDQPEVRQRKMRAIVDALMEVV